MKFKKKLNSITKLVVQGKFQYDVKYLAFVITINIRLNKG